MRSGKRSGGYSTALVSGLVVFSGFTPVVQAWGAAGHEMIATIAQIHLHPSVLPTICALLDVGISASDDPSDLRYKCHLASVATWADKDRMKMRWSAAMHYVGAVDDFPREHCDYPGPQGWAGTRSINVLDATKNVTRILAEWSGADETHGSSSSSHYVPPYSSRQTYRRAQGKIPSPLEEEALKFLIHFVGDMHQPLHLTGRARGGNSIKVRFGNKQSNLHSVWDTSIPTKLIRTVSSNYSHPLPDAYYADPESSPYFSLRGSSALELGFADDYPGYTPPSSAQIESALRGTIYDSLLRRIMWEGVRERWAVPHQDPTSDEEYSEVDTWGLCPPVSNHSALSTSNEAPQSNADYGNSDGAQAALVPHKEPLAIDPDGPLICPFAWSQPIHTLNCEYIWPAGVDLQSTDEAEEDTAAAYPSRPKSPLLDLDVPSYMGPLEREMVVEKLIAQGGLRLAGILNWLFADWDQ
ncbi:phospholipase C/P1 nuclease [Coprinopsis marcescibilis]|uniref:Phospholipase C/P1 nuclease n=1 Tax=Coprinopsis marcescibilis TaxID=230819 RepID=A0A5C3KJZ1_COPMA|nr:phospholipase C/P1 nuclease [Coprinopsis marcescibilis]